ncbi:MAG: pilus assembly protein PilP, partial [bacterium]
DKGAGLMNRIWMLLIFLVFTGCSENANISDLEQFTEEAFKDHTPEVEPLPALRPQAVFIYTASGLIDPFDRENLKEKIEDLPSLAGADGPDQSRRKEPLEAFPLDSLKLVGVLAQNDQNWAVIRAPDKTVHRVKQGNYMGVNFGEILAVDDNTVAVSELVKNPVGRWEKKEANLILVE